MKAKMTSIFVGTALLAGVGIANAEERLTAASMDGVTAGTYSVYFTKYINTDVQSNLQQYKDVNSNVYVDGKLADAEASASCSAYSCLTETLTVTNTGAYAPTSSYSQSLSATN
jgi:hypothetical protein